MGEILANQNTDQTWHQKIKTQLSQIHLPWGGGVYLRAFDDSHGINATLQFECRLDRQEMQVKQAIQELMKACPAAAGQVCCVGDNAYDLRILVAEEGKLFERKGNVQFDFPGSLIFMR